MGDWYSPLAAGKWSPHSTPMCEDRNIRHILYDVKYVCFYGFLQQYIGIRIVEVTHFDLPWKEKLLLIMSDNGCTILKRHTSSYLDFASLLFNLRNPIQEVADCQKLMPSNPLLKHDSAIIHFVRCTCNLPVVTGQNVFWEKTHLI